MATNTGDQQIFENIFSEGELDSNMVVSKMEITAPHGAIIGNHFTPLTFCDMYPFYWTNPVKGVFV